MQTQVRASAQGAIAQAPTDAWHLQVRLDAVIGQAALAVQCEFDGARPLRGECSRIESLRVGLDLPGQLRLQSECALGLQSAIGLLQLNALEFDAAGVALDVDVDIRQRALRTERELPERAVVIRMAAQGQAAMTVQGLAHPFRRQLQILPAGGEIRLRRVRGQIQRAAHLQASGCARYGNLQLFDVQGLVGQCNAQRFERHAVCADAKQAVHIGVPAVATAVQLQGKIAQRAVGEHALRGKRGNLHREGPRQLGALANRGVDAGLAGLVEIQLQTCLSTFAACIHGAG